MSSAAITMKDLSRAFSYRYVLRQLDLTIDQGETVVLIGPNGSGKTTLLRIMATLLRPTSGQVRFGGLPSHRSELRRSLGVLLTEGFLYRDLTVWENLRFYLHLIRPEQDGSSIEPWLERLQILHLAHERVAHLSRGQKQRVAWLRSFIHEPRIMLWDEPTTGMDEKSRQIFEETVRQKKPEQTVVCVTHDHQSQLAWADRLLRLENGRIA